MNEYEEHDCLDYLECEECLYYYADFDQESGMMKRLTYRTTKGEAMGDSSVADIGDILGKLAEYEDLEEQGLLLRLPCKVGDTVHELDIFLERNPLIIEMRVTDIIIRDDDIYFELVDLYDDNYTNSVLITEFGRTVFLTQAEAEQKLKEMESD